MTDCQYPENTPLTGYQWGCRCDRCSDERRRYMRDYFARNGEKYKKPPAPPRLCPTCSTPFKPTGKRCYVCRPIPPPKPPRPKSTRKHRRRDGGLTRHQRGYGHQWEKLRLVILSRDAYICAYCDRYADTVDHIKPKVEGGDDDPANLVAACRSCNSRRAAQWLNLQRRLRAADQS